MTTYRLPSGKTTKSRLGYARAWRKIAHQLEKRFPGYTVHSCDPGFRLYAKNSHEEFNIPLGAAKALIGETLCRTIWSSENV